MSERKCDNCEWFEWYGYHTSGECRRFPRWLDIKLPDIHYCGEFKEREE